MKKLLLTLSLLAGFSTLSAIGAQPLTMGIDPTFPPFESKDAQGKLVGFDIDLGKAICSRIQRECQFVELPFDALIPALKARKFSVILSSLSINDERRQSVDFSVPLYTSPVWLVAPAKAGLSDDLTKLAGKRIGVQQGTIFESYANQHWRGKGVEVVAYQNDDQIYADLAAGRLDATLDDAIVASSVFLSKPQGAGFALNGKEIYQKSLFGQGTGMGFRKGEDQALQAQVNKAIADIRADGTFTQLSQRYFKVDVTPKS